MNRFEMSSCASYLTKSEAALREPAIMPHHVYYAYDCHSADKGDHRKEDVEA